TIIIMTSNIGSGLIRENFENMNDRNHDEVVEKTKNQVFELLKQTIRPEFLNRIDELIMFAPLNESQIEAIVRLQISLIQKTLRENSIELQLTEAAIHFIADEGFDPQFGARPVKRAIQKYVLNDLSKQLIAGTVHNNETITVDFDGERLVYRN
ncbi:MAG TPA: AAA family ATPase, partial [Paludibacter sp.]|nr:AAA family ATPase [Paludibacter sp.]